MAHFEPLVTVIILSYNHEKFLKAAIDSAINQTYNHLEIIVTDDCSSDNSKRIIDSFNDSRLIKVYNKINLGAAINNNNAIKMAKGEYIAILNSDDYWDYNKIEKEIRFLEENKQYGAVFSDAFIINEKNKIVTKNKYFDVNIFKQENRDRYGWIRKFFYEQNCLCHPSILIRKEIYYKTDLYNPLFKQLPDYKMWIDIIKITNIYIMQEKLIYYRVLENAENTSANYGSNVIRHRNEIVLIMKSFFDDMVLEDFIKSFSNDLINKEINNLYELEIEQAFLYLRMQNKLNFLYYSIAIEKLYYLLQDENSRKILIEKYNFSFNDFFEITGKTGYSSLSKYSLYLKDEMSSYDKFMFILNKLRKYI